MKYLAITVLLAIFTCASAQRQKTSSSAEPHAIPEIPTVVFCDLISNPKQYDQKVVRVQAIYRYGFEWSELYCLECLEARPTWVDFDDSFASCTDAKVAEKIKGNGSLGRTVRIIAVGKFYGTGDGYGHMNDYQFKFQVSCIEKAEIILNESPVPLGLPKEVLRRMHCKGDSSESRQR